MAANRTVKVSNISLSASQHDLKEFFSYSGDVDYIEMQSESERSQVAYVTFKDEQGADTSVLLSGATIAEYSVTVTHAENYQLPPQACRPLKDENKTSGIQGTYGVKRAEDMVSSMLAKGYILGKDALKRARSFDKKYHLISNASSAVASINCRLGLTDKIGIGTAIVNDKMKEVDGIFGVSEITRSAMAAAEQKASIASSVILSNHYVLTGASLVSSAFNHVAKAVEDVNVMTREKVEKAEEEKRKSLYGERKEVVTDFVRLHLDDDDDDDDDHLGN